MQDLRNCVSFGFENCVQMLGAGLFSRTATPIESHRAIGSSALRQSIIEWRERRRLREAQPRGQKSDLLEAGASGSGVESVWRQAALDVISQLLTVRVWSREARISVTEVGMRGRAPGGERLSSKAWAERRRAARESQAAALGAAPVSSTGISEAAQQVACADTQAGAADAESSLQAHQLSLAAMRSCGKLVPTAAQPATAARLQQLLHGGLTEPAIASLNTAPRAVPTLLEAAGSTQTPPEARVRLLGCLAAYYETKCVDVKPEEALATSLGILAEPDASTELQAAARRLLRTVKLDLLRVACAHITLTSIHL